MEAPTGAPNTRKLLQCFGQCARPTGDSYGRTTEAHEQRFVIMAAMALYFVTMHIQETAGPKLPVHRLASIVREAILPSVKALIPLRAQGRLITGGYLVGERSMVFVFEADSEEEVRKVLEGLPISGVVTTDVRHMRALGELHALEEL
jgi:muconolactone delta-isomerase